MTRSLLLAAVWFVVCAGVCLTQTALVAAADVMPVPPPPEDDARPAEKGAAKAPADPNALPTTFQGRPFVIIPKVDVPKGYKLKGDTADPLWKQGVRLPFVDASDGSVAPVLTSARLFCTDEALYAAIRCYEPNPDKMELKGEMSQKDSIELFFEPFADLTQRMYHMVLLSAGGDFWTSRIHFYLRGHARLREEWIPVMEFAVGKGEGYWSVEMKIPFKQMVFSKEAPAGKSLWRLGAFRRRPNGYEMYGWTTTGMRDCAHKASRFGFVLPEVFATPELLKYVRENWAKQAPPPAPPDEKKLARIKQVVMELLDPKTRGQRVAAWTEFQRLAASSAPEADALDAALDQALASLPKEAYRTQLGQWAKWATRRMRDEPAEDRPPPDLEDDGRQLPDGDPLAPKREVPKPPDDAAF